LFFCIQQKTINTHVKKGHKKILFKVTKLYSVAYAKMLFLLFKSWAN
jgi:hypothetical protein